MVGRLTVFTACTFGGFLGGIFAYFAYERLLPVIEMFPELLNTEWFLSGLAGAIMALILMLVWAKLSPEKIRI